jgi:hypothetical protein
LLNIHSFSNSTGGEKDVYKLSSSAWVGAAQECGSPTTIPYMIKLRLPHKIMPIFPQENSSTTGHFPSNSKGQS